MSDIPSTTPLASLESLWKDAFESYEKTVGHEFPKGDLADKLCACTTPDGIYAVLESKEGEFKAFRAKGQRIRNFLAPIVHVVQLFTDTGAEAATSAGVPGGKAIFVAFGVLLTLPIRIIQAAKGVSAVYDGLETLMVKLGSFLDRLQIHLDAPTLRSADGLTSVLVRILAQLLHVLALATKYLEGSVSDNRLVRSIKARIPRRIRHYMGNFMGERDVADALEYLDRLTGDELAMTLAEARRAALEARTRAEAARLAAENAARGAQRVETEVKAVQQIQLDNRITEWLSAPDPFFNHNRLRNIRHSRQTAEWVFDDKFNDWKCSANDVFWVHECAGLILAHSRKRKKRPLGLHLAFFYFDFRDARKQNERDLLASLVLQFGSLSKNYHSRLTEFHSKHSQTVGHPDEDTLTLCLRYLLLESPNVCIVLDALDEWPDSVDEEPRHRILLPLLLELRGLGTRGVRLLLTSRPEQDIRELMVPIVPHQLALHEAKPQVEAIRRFIRSELSKDSHVTDYRNWSIALKEEVAEELALKADGM
ncbi:hypothetical protein K488DRAFT_68355 [Vararia minispora EC-137]|uniref:Uncharacterized protein n=1 Tax=Vararia minispora EC-137 TaxID=1314806 RepID=A0ACB8QUI6_9AGAM|nr:hypothetical protein K488DRAFT_68355 [Vararia minispora EC-137]